MLDVRVVLSAVGNREQDLAVTEHDDDSGGPTGTSFNTADNACRFEVEGESRSVPS